MNKDFIQRVVNYFHRRFDSPLGYARHIGVNIGEGNLIGKDHWWSSEPYLITVGNNCQLTNCKIFTHGGGKAARYFDPEFDLFGKVVIEDDVYIGTDSLIMPGVTVGKNSLVAAGSVVTKSVAPFTVVAGNPAKYICTVEEYFQRNAKYNIRTKSLHGRRKKEFLLSVDDGKFIKK
jgi:acetyltransferase-like isoleucine patch superfamily enzyme